MIPNQVFQSIVERSRDAVILLAETEKLVYANPVAKSMLSLPDNYQPRSIAEFESDGVRHLLQESTVASGFDSVPPVREGEIRMPDGRLLWVEIWSDQFNVDGFKFRQINLRNINRSKQKETVLEQQANTDFLSGLSNRRQFQRTLKTNLDQAITVAIVDVDNFKRINDTFGHLMGDAAIRFIARMLLNSFGDDLCVARLGGEEFGVILRKNDRATIVSSLDEFREEVERSSFLEQSCRLTVSIGVAFAVASESDVPSLMQRADTALYDAKNTGRNQVRVFSAEEPGNR